MNRLFPLSRRRKRAIVFFGWILAIIGMLTLSLAFVTMRAKEDKISLSRSVGTNQFEIFGAYQSGEEYRYSIDMAAKRAAERAAVYLGPQGGFHDGADSSECGEIDGYAIWHQEGRDCYPNVGRSFATLIDKQLFEVYFTEGNLDIPKSGYLYKITGGPLTIEAKAVNFTAINISDPEHLFLINGWPAEGSCVEELDYLTSDGLCFVRGEPKRGMLRSECGRRDGVWVKYAPSYSGDCG